MQTRGLCVVGLALAVALASGCGGGEPSNAPTTADFAKERQALAANKGKPKATGKAGAKAGKKGQKSGGGTQYATGGRDYFYDPTGKRDPFRSFQFDDEGKKDRKSFGPLADFELGQLELSAVIWEASNPRALILDPGGRSYIVREGVLDREGRDVDRDGVQPGLADDLDVVVDQVLLGRDEEHVHLPLLRIRRQDLEVEVDLVHVERDVLLGLPLDLPLELLATHLREVDPLDDDRMTGHGGGDVLAPDTTVGDRLANRLDDRARIQECALDDRLGSERRLSERAEIEALVPALARDLDGFDRVRPDVESDRGRLSEAR